MVTGTQPERAPLAADWLSMEARAIAYASKEVLAALEAAGNANDRYDLAVEQWQHTRNQPQGAGQLAADRKAAENAKAEADRLYTALLDLMRAELQAGSRASQMVRHDGGGANPPATPA